MDMHAILDKLKTSLKFDKKVWMTLIYDLSFYFVTFVLIMAWSAFITWQSSGAKGVQSLMNQTNADLQAIQGSLASFLVMLILSIIIVYIAYLKIFAYFKGKIWFTLAEKELTYHKWLRLFGMSALILSPFFIIFLALVSTFGPTNALGIFILFPILNHFATFLFLNFTKKRKFWKTVGRAFSQGFKMIPKLIIPYAIIFLTGWALNSFFKLIFVDNIVFSISVLLVYLVWVTWARYYVYINIESYI